MISDKLLWPILDSFWFQTEKILEKGVSSKGAKASLNNLIDNFLFQIFLLFLVIILMLTNCNNL